MVTSFHLVSRCLDKLRNIQSIPIYPLERNTLGGGKKISVYPLENFHLFSREPPFILQRISIYIPGGKKKIQFILWSIFIYLTKKKKFYFIHLKNSINAPEHPYLLSRINLHVTPHLHFSIYPPEKSQFMLHENLNLCSLQQIAGQIPPKVLKVWRFFKTQSTWFSP